MGSCAALWALKAVDYDALLRWPPPPAPPGSDSALWAMVLNGSARPGDDTRELLCEQAEQVPLEARAVAKWRDLADNDLSRLAQGEAFDRLPGEIAAEVLGRPELRALSATYPVPVLSADEKAALESLRGLLGLEPFEPASVPWWVQWRWSAPGQGFWVGIMAPEAVSRLRDALRQSCLFERLSAWDQAAFRRRGGQDAHYRAKTYSSLEHWIAEAADQGCAILGVEGQS